jgi:predicted nucleic-acid-binding protein
VIGLDTNVLVRYVMQDDPRQSPRAARLIESLSADSPGFVPVVSLIELAWVLSGSYGLNRGQLAAVMAGLLRSKELVLDRAEAVAQALGGFVGSSAEFADLLIERLANAAGCTATMTFDVGAVKAARMTPVP